MAQSNRQIDISHDWVIALQVSRIEEAPRGLGKKIKLNPVEKECQFPVSIEVNQNANPKTDIDSFMPVSEVSPVFNPSCVLDIQHEEDKGDDHEEYRLFGTPSNSHDHPTMLLIQMMKKMKWTMMPVPYLSLC